MRCRVLTHPPWIDWRGQGLSVSRYTRHPETSDTIRLSQDTKYDARPVDPSRRHEEVRLLIPGTDTGLMLSGTQGERRWRRRRGWVPVYIPHHLRFQLVQPRHPKQAHTSLYLLAHYWGILHQYRRERNQCQATVTHFVSPSVHLPHPRRHWRIRTVDLAQRLGHPGRGLSVRPSPGVYLHR